MPRKKMKIEKAKGSYLTIGHDGYKRGVFNEKKPNYMWGFVKGRVHKEAETPECHGHGMVSRWRGKCWDFNGRYDAKKKIISCVIHTDNISCFRKLPKTLVSHLEQSFPKAKKIVVFD
jgi:hypothetical protein